MALNFSLNDITQMSNAAAAQDNMAAVQQVQHLIDAGKSLNLSFYQKDGKAKVWVEEAALRGMRLEGFSAALKTQNQLINLFFYLFSGNARQWVEDGDDGAEPLDPETFQLDLFKLVVRGGMPITIKPEFLTRNKAMVYATLPLKKGSILFKLPRTEQLEEFIENPMTTKLN